MSNTYIKNNHSINYNKLQFQESAIEALQEATENLIYFFKDTNLYTIYTKKVIILLKNIYLIKRKYNLI